MSTLYRWEKIVLVILAVLSFVAGYQSGSHGSVFNGLMTLIINVLIGYALFRIGNKIFRSKKQVG